MTRIVRHRAVQDDLEVIVRYLAPRNLEATLRLIDALEATLNELAKFPGLGTHPSFLNAHRHRDVRFRLIAPFPNYMVFYREIEHVIEILHVLHGARDIPAIFEP